MPKKKKKKAKAQPPRLKWAGSLAAMRQHRAAVDATRNKKRKKSRKAKRAARRARKEAITGKKAPPPRTLPPSFVPGLKYAEYLKTEWWLAKREEKLAAVGRKCNRCARDRDLQVHHLHYRSLWREKLTDLEVLCRGCHEQEHESLIRAQRHLDAIASRPD